MTLNYTNVRFKKLRKGNLKTFNNNKLRKNEIKYVQWVKKFQDKVTDSDKIKKQKDLLKTNSFNSSNKINNQFKKEFSRVGDFYLNEDRYRDIITEYRNSSLISPEYNGSFDFLDYKYNKKSIQTYYFFRNGVFVLNLTINIKGGFKSLKEFLLKNIIKIENGINYFEHILYYSIRNSNNFLLNNIMIAQLVLYSIKVI